MADSQQYSIDTSHLDFDPNEMREKYTRERDKRIRKEGFGQYQATAGEFSNFIDDHYVEPGFTREPLFDEVDVVIIGGGFGGLLTGAHLREAGVKNIRVIDKAGDFGGTWYWNRYPGAQCDVESFVYMPLLEELDYIPSERYAHAPEILEHSKNIAKKYDLYKDTCFQTEVTEIRWDESISRWIIHTNRGDEMKAHFVAMSNGILTRPKLPGIPGIENFKGHTFHTSRWDYDYTGGSSAGELTNLKDKRVGIIGTGATAVQCIPHLGEAAKQLYVFQRTPSSVDVRKNAPTSPEWIKKLKPGWHQKRVENFNFSLTGGEPDKDLVGDGWTDVANAAKEMQRDKPSLSADQKKEALEIADLKKMQEIRDRVNTIVQDKKTAEALKAYYWQFCKRPCFHDEYLDTYNLSNVELVDTLGQGVERITETGVIVNGTEYELDCLIFATGFEVGGSYTGTSGYDVIGRDGAALSKKWDEGLATFHGMYSHGYPNCFFLGFTQTAVTANVTHMLNEQARHIAHVIAHGVNNGLSTIEASQEAEKEWIDIIEQHSGSAEQLYIKCTPGYYNNEGASGNRNGFFSGQFGGGPGKFFKILSDWRDEGSLKGLDIN
ncbi:MAG: NAD(P)/FAD-dependent oxidoreductase [Pseudomonadales bacterium]|nr:NAD(P)/FAD-dependent oxidoreductase [Pseudomonadales bacterium]